MFTDSRKANRTFLHSCPLGRFKSPGSLPECNGFGWASRLRDFLLYLSVSPGPGGALKKSHCSSSQEVRPGTLIRDVCLPTNECLVGKIISSSLRSFLPQIYFRCDECELNPHSCFSLIVFLTVPFNKRSTHINQTIKN